MMVDEWLGLSEKDEAGAVLQLINAILWAGTVRTDLTMAELESEEELSEVLTGFQEGLDPATLAAGLLVGKKKASQAFQRAFVDFWSKWAQAVFVNAAGAAERMGGRFLPWLILVSTSQFRPLRQAGALASFAVLVGLSRASAELSTQLERASRISKAGSKASVLVDVLTGQIAATEKVIQSLFSTVYVQRFRDVDATIRVWALEQLGRFIVGQPSLFLDNHYLRYLGWGLSDKSETVRLAAVEALDQLYRDKGNHGAMAAFTERFKPRILEMALRDVDDGVRREAQCLLLRLFSVDLVALEELEAVDRLVLGMAPLGKEGCALVFARCFGSTKDDSEAELFRCIARYLAGLGEEMGETGRLRLAEHLVSILSGSISWLKDPARCLALADASESLHWAVLEAVFRISIYPSMKRVVLARPSGLEASAKLAAAVMGRLTELLTGLTETDDLALLAIFECVPLMDLAPCEGLEDFSDALLRLFSMAETSSQDALAAGVQAMQFLASAEHLAATVEAQAQAMLSACLRAGTVASLSKAALLLSFVRLPAAYELPMDAVTEAGERQSVMVQLSYQELLWRLMDERAAPMPRYERVIPLRDEIAMGCALSKTSTAALVMLDLYHLFGPKQDAVSPGWRYAADTDMSELFGEMDEIFQSADLETQIKLAMGSARLAMNDYECKQLLPFLAKWYGASAALGEVLMAAIDLVKDHLAAVQMVNLTAGAIHANVAHVAEAGGDASKCIALARLLANHYKRANPSAMAAELTRLNQCFIDSLAGEYSKTIVAIAALFVPLLPPTAGINIDAIKGNARLATYAKALEKHLGKASRAKKLQLTPQKRRAHAAVGGSRLKQAHQEDAFERDDDETSQEELADDNDYHELQTSPAKSELGTNLFRQMALGYEDGGASGLGGNGGTSDLHESGSASDMADSPMPLRKRTILRS